MSSSSIATKAPPLGAATIRAFHARSQEMLAQRQDLRERRGAERRAELTARGVSGAERLGELAGRCDAVAGLVPERQVVEVRKSLERAAAQGREEEIAPEIERLERDADRIAEERLQQEMLLEAVAAANEGEVLSRVEWSADGSGSAIVGFPDEVRIRVTVSRQAAEEWETITWHTADSNIASQTAAGKTSCAAELDYLRDIVASYPEMSFDEQSRAEAEAAAAEEAEAEEEDEGWEEMEAL